MQLGIVGISTVFHLYLGVLANRFAFVQLSAVSIVFISEIQPDLFR